MISISHSEVIVTPHGQGLLMEEEEMQLVFSLINTNETAVAFEVGIDVLDLPNNEDRNEGPRRDPIEGRFALFQDTNYFGLVSQSVFDRLEVDYENFNNANDLADADLDEFDAIWVVGCDQSDAFVRGWSDNLDRFEEYVSRGKAMFIEEGWNRTNLVELPGGLRDNRSPQEGILVVGPEDNWMIEQCEFEEGQGFRCGNTTHVVYPEDRIEDIEDSDWYQIIMESDQSREPCEFIYQYGRGFVVVSGQPSSHVWIRHWGQGARWGDRAPFLLEWLIMLGAPQWIIADPEEGEIPANQEYEFNINLNALDMEAGTYWAVIELELDQIEQTLLQFPVLMSIESPVFAINGSVLDEDGGAALSGVTVATDPFDFRRISDDEGGWTIADFPTGNYEFTFTAPDYLPLTVERNVDEAGEIDLEVSLLHSLCLPTPEDVFRSLAPDTDMEMSLEIANDGNGPLTYSIERRLLGDANADPWTIRRTYNVGANLEESYVQGVVFANDQFFVAGRHNREPAIYVLDREGNLDRTFEQPGDDDRGFKDLAWDGTLIWGCDRDNVYGFTTDGEVEFSFEAPQNPSSNIAWDSDLDVLWISSTTSNIVAVDVNGNEVDEINREGLRMYGLGYYADDPDDQPLYIFAKESDPDRSVVYKANTNEGNISFVSYIDSEEGGVPAAVEITNEFDIYSYVFIAIANNPTNDGGDRVDIWQIDARKDWMQIDPTAGVIEAAATQEFSLILDASGLPAELFEGELLVTHDGVGGETRIPISLDVVEGPVHAEFPLELIMGWSMVSAYLAPDEEDIRALMRPLVDEDLLLMMKDGIGRFYNPEYNYNSIPFWNVAEGYLIKMESEGTLTLEGTTVVAEEPLDLVEGWQMISYYLRHPVDAVIALSGLDGNLIMAKDGIGRFYNAEYGYSNMGDMSAGNGYLIKLSEDDELIYRMELPDEDELAGLPSRSNSRVPTQLPSHAVTPVNMSLLVLDDNSLDSEVGVYVDGILVGSGVLISGRAGIAIWGDDPTTPEKDGAVEGDRYEIRVIQEGALLNAEFSLVRGNGHYTTNDFAVVEVTSSQIPQEFGIISAYPNPFNSSTRLTFSLPAATDVKIGLFDLTGRRALVLPGGKHTAGVHNLTIDGSSLSSGVYVVRIEADSKVAMQKITLVK
ncbi:T9SS type A sorting domain-containing protein [bacterium]|nr:T9SS type A sorting domain-containing protein [bacterium]